MYFKNLCVKRIRANFLPFCFTVILVLFAGCAGNPSTSEKTENNSALGVGESSDIPCGASDGMCPADCGVADDVDCLPVAEHEQPSVMPGKQGAAASIAAPCGGVKCSWGYAVDTNCYCTEYIASEKTCEEMGGHICNSGLQCASDIITTRDADVCCKSECSKIDECYSYTTGGYLCKEGQLCNGKWLKAVDSKYCCPVSCKAEEYYLPHKHPEQFNKYEILLGREPMLLCYYGDSFCTKSTYGYSYLKEDVKQTHDYLIDFMGGKTFLVNAAEYYPDPVIFYRRSEWAQQKIEFPILEIQGSGQLPRRLTDYFFEFYFEETGDASNILAGLSILAGECVNPYTKENPDFNSFNFHNTLCNSDFNGLPSAGWQMHENPVYSQIGVGLVIKARLDYGCDFEHCWRKVAKYLVSRYAGHTLTASKIKLALDNATGKDTSELFSYFGIDPADDAYR